MSKLGVETTDGIAAIRFDNQARGTARLLRWGYFAVSQSPAVNPMKWTWVRFMRSHGC
jgi:hypothetical protein